MSVDLQIGDVFSVPTGDGRFGVGQVIGKYGSDAYFFAIFQDTLVAEGESSTVSQILLSPVRFIALSLDAKVHAGHWEVVGRAPVRGDIPLPAFKEVVGAPDRFYVVDSTGKRRRRATVAEAAALPNRKVVAPVRLEHAIRASLGLEPWLDAFDELEASSIVPESVVFEA